MLIDALDKCNAGSDREELLRLIITQERSSNAKWLLTSRHQADIRRLSLAES
jgi:hypothetical protein